ncbi:MAG: UDP-N-acetylmuramoyl-L-alanyl-D-glutamate--2,6-diaminopimelate ligase [Erysipelotrichaceae bacterium]|nr:UDP-N-acetylmuramoyl-L-alanyl-D-glutamate--2,6-diaminopimelate ligase [Erysipelotrichaceae bacterium]
MLLSRLFEGAPEIEIESLMADSRVKSKNSIFFCIKGMVNDGHKFIQQAKDNGAIVIVHSDDIKDYDADLIYIRVVNVLDTLNVVASRFYGDCTHKMTMFGVTGTNGKSTITTVIRNLLNHFEPCGYIGTIGIFYGDVEKDAMLTTPDIVPLHRTLDEMYQAGMKSVSMEVSSAGLDMHRCDSIDFDYAIYTNLTHDHLDLHGTMENYYEAKEKLFTLLKPNKTAIINIDDEYSDRFIQATKANVVTYGVEKECTYRAVDIQLMVNCTKFTLLYDNVEYPVETNLVAKFNVYNLLAAIAALHEYGVSIEDILSRVNNLPQVLGRMERIVEGQPFTVIVDYAHTPDGFIKIYEYAKSITAPDKRIITVFGSAGNRDAKKRIDFGRLSDRYCDLIILTEEDPRNESAEDIANEIRKGIENTACIFIESRYDAIRQAIEVANVNDTILILGKGDENYLSYEFGKTEWMGDHIAAKDAIHKYYFGESEENVYENE